MKLISIVKNLIFVQMKKPERSEYSLFHNNNEIENIKVISHALHRETFKHLRHFKIPQYNRIYLMKRKKAFNTLFFQLSFDVVVADRDGIVLDALTDVETGYISNHYQEGYFVFFMTVGSINHYNIKVKDRLKINSKAASKWL